MKTQYETVKNHLTERGYITSWQAIIDYRITRLSHYIYLLKRNGHDLHKEWGHNGKKRFAIYKLNKNN